MEPQDVTSLRFQNVYWCFTKKNDTLFSSVAAGTKEAATHYEKVRH